MPPEHVKPVFLLSLPRSGSTLVQRVLSAHPDVATAAEPWVALPPLLALRGEGIAADYDHAVLAKAVTAFAEQLPEGVRSYHRRVGELLSALYRDAAPPGARWFLDKTPRYHMIVDELLACLPDARIIFLWRNQLAVVASLTQAYKVGWYPYRHAVDLYDGLASLTAAGARLVADPRVTAVRYESLVSDPAAWHALLAHLDLRLDDDQIAEAAGATLAGVVGDPTQGRYEEVSDAPLHKWRGVLDSPPRKDWALGYLDWIGEERLSVMGYDLQDLRGQLQAVPVDWRQAVPDVLDGARQRVFAARRRWREGGRVDGGAKPRGPRRA